MEFGVEKERKFLPDGVNTIYGPIESLDSSSYEVFLSEEELSNTRQVPSLMVPRYASSSNIHVG